MTSLERRLYLALMGARTIVSATANVNPQAHRILTLVDRAAEDYKRQESREQPAQLEEQVDASGE